MRRDPTASGGHQGPRGVVLSNKDQMHGQPKESAYVINMGDIIDKFTNGYSRSARHGLNTSDTEGL